MTIFDLESTFATELPELAVEWQPTPVPAPSMVALNRSLAGELLADPTRLESPAAVAALAGNAPIGVDQQPVALAYAGHQFGSYSPQLGDGRALLLGEIVLGDGCRLDLHLKGSGRTPFARGGDGRAVLGPMLRELIVGEALHALGIPTTRALAVVATGDEVARQGLEPGALLARVATSHIRVGTFELAAHLTDRSVVTRLADHTIRRHYPDAATSDEPYLSLLDGVVEAQAHLVAQWMLVGFIHGVMNTDNMAVSGEGIDYGPCAFMDYYDPATVFSSIDHAGRYAYGNQPRIAHWNLARFAETLLGSIDADIDAAASAATEVLNRFPERFARHWSDGMRSKLGLVSEEADDADLFDDLLALLHHDQVDYTTSFRNLARALRGDQQKLRSQFRDQGPLDSWLERWRTRLSREHRHPLAAAAEMDSVNPVYIPRNHLVEAALDAASSGELEPFHELVAAVTAPFEERPDLERFSEPADEAFTKNYRTFCGT